MAEDAYPWLVSEITLKEFEGARKGCFQYDKSKRKCMHYTQCMFCHKEQHSQTSRPESDICTCESPNDCENCIDDIKKNKKHLESTIIFHCLKHGDFRNYQQKLLRYRNWCILWVTILIIPYGMALFQTGIDLNWVYFVASVFVIPVAPTVVMVLVWSKTTGAGIVAGALIGLICGAGGLVGGASYYPGGASLFLENTAQDYAVLAGGGASMLASVTVTIVVSLCTTNVRTENDSLIEWGKMFCIDNPLRPWVDVYREDFPNLEKTRTPTAQEMINHFRPAKIVAWTGTIISLIFFIGIIPGVMAYLGVLEFIEFEAWMYGGHAWCFVAGFVVYVFAPIEEVIRTCRQWKHNKQLEKGHTHEHINHN